MNITIFSGGTGSISLTNGLKNISNNIHISTIINAYDDGKSTGIVRKVCCVLGPSDIRKRQINLYKCQNKIIDKRILEFYENRIDIYIDNKIQYCLSLLDLYGLSILNKYIIDFFSREESKKYIYTNFNLSNIIYAEMFSQIGYEKTIEYFNKLLNISDDVILHSFDNLTLKAVLLNNDILLSEADIVNYKNEYNKIVDIFTENYKGEKVNATPNVKAIEAILNSKLIIFSPGTQWSSLIPTYICKDISEAINSSTAVKILIMNNSEDSDSFGISNLDFIDIIGKYLDLKTITIFNNLDAVELLRLYSPNVNNKYYNLGNNNGLHDSKLLTNKIFSTYFNILNDLDCLMLDFDDTIYTRQIHDEDKVKISIENLTLLNDISKYIDVKIITGNTYKRLYERLSPVFGTEIEVNFDLWADGGVVNYKNNNIIYNDEKYYIKDFKNIMYTLNEIEYIKDKISFWGYRNSIEECVVISIKPLEENYRLLLFKYLKSLTIPARLTGKTTIDIMNENVNKSEIFNILQNIKHLNTLYIGDEIDDKISGNDRDIALKCTNYYQVNSIYETNILFKILLEKVSI